MGGWVGGLWEGGRKWEEWREGGELWLVCRMNKIFFYKRTTVKAASVGKT